MQDTVIVKDRQTLLDIAIQESGSIEAVFELAMNNGLSITELLSAGTVLNKVPVVVPEVVNYYAINELLPASADETGILGGIGYWRIGYDFIVS